LKWNIKEITNIVEESDFYKHLNIIERKSLLERLKDGKLSCFELVRDFNIYEALYLECDSKREELLSYLSENVLEIFKSGNKYSLDMVISYLDKNDYKFTKKQNEELAKNVANLSLVSKELLFGLEDLEINSLKSNVNQAFNISSIELELKKISGKDKTKY